MGKEIVWDRIVWNEGDDFVAFAFGDYDSKFGGIIRTSNGNRYDSALSAPISDKTAEIPGGDGAYFFGSTHKPKIFNVNFAFDNLSARQLRELKKAFAGKDIRELCFAEEPNKIYMAKVTGQPTIKSLCFGVGSEEVHKGEGSV
jgi:predicted phage tail component-like protein